MSTSIAEWQMELRNQQQPFIFTIMSELRQAILNATEWVERPDAGDVEYWKRYRVKVDACIHTCERVWNESPDEEFNTLWTSKHDALVDLYNTLHLMFVKHSFEPHQADIYREKVEQSIDLLTEELEGVEFDLSDFPFIQADMDIFGLSALDSAKQILNRRATWISKMVEIEKVRIPTKRAILQAQSPITVKRELDAALLQLKEFDEQWI